MKVAEAFKANLFWDVNPGKLDWNKNRRFVVERVMVRGGMQDVSILMKIYTEDQIIEALKKKQGS